MSGGLRVLVVGGGIVGLACAWEAVKRGYRVTVAEAGAFGGQASGAAAGMLAPFSENTDGPDSFFRLCLDSLRLYPDWVADIENASGIKVNYCRSGSLGVALHEADLLSLRTRQRWQNGWGAGAEWIEGETLFRMEPGLARSSVAGLFCPEESHVSAPKLVRALEEACRRSGVVLVPGVGWAERLEVTPGSRTVALHTREAGRLAADRVVLCAGAWSAMWERWLPLVVPVHPIRGQICAYEGAATQVRHMVFTSQAYWVGKADGSLVCGASEDVAGFDRTVTARGIGRLTRWTGRLFPALSAQSPQRGWAGLRPATRDGWPLIGIVPGVPEAIVAAGHYRNGILLSPITARLVANELDDAATPYGGAFSPGRFGVFSSTEVAH